MKKLIICIIALGTVLISLVTFAYIKGRPVKISTDKEVENLPEDISDIIYHASLAPNSHNTQLWKVRIDLSKNILIISLDSNRTLKQVDSSNREAYISIGAFTANLIKSFKAYGYETTLNIADKDSSGLVTVNFTKSNNIKEDKSMLDLIERRHTDKSAFLDKIISEEDMNQILNDNTLYFKKGSEQFKYLKAAETEAMKQQSYDRAKADEFADWLRFSDKEAETKKD